MQNEAFTFGELTLINLRYKGDIISAMISTEDLPRVSAINGRWYAMNVGSTRGKETIYVGTRIGGRIVYLHKLLMMNPPGTVVDHINHDTLDNTRENLRVATLAENQQNRKGEQSNNSTGYRNVVPLANGKFRVKLQKDGKVIYIGNNFKTAEEANEAAIKARQKHFGGISK